MTDTILATAEISGHEATGSARISRAGNGDLVLKLIDYHIAPGAPDVRVYLSPSEDANVRADGVVDLGRVTQFDGHIDIAIPAGVDVAAFRTVVVYCKVYSVEFGRGKLTGP